jgi:hypothetical protein
MCQNLSRRIGNIDFDIRSFHERGEFKKDLYSTASLQRRDAALKQTHLLGRKSNFSWVLEKDIHEWVGLFR